MADAPQTEHPLIPKGGKLSLRCQNGDCFVDTLDVTTKGGRPMRSPSCPHCAGPLEAYGGVFLPPSLSSPSGCTCGHPASDHIAPNWRGQMCGGPDVPWDACTECCCNGSVSALACAEAGFEHPGGHEANLSLFLGLGRFDLAQRLIDAIGLGSQDGR